MLRIGVWAGAILSFAPIICLHHTLVGLFAIAGMLLQTAEGVEEFEDRYTCSPSIYDFILLMPIGALLVVCCLAALLRRSPPRECIIEIPSEGKSIAWRRTIGWGIDLVVILFLCLTTQCLLWCGQSDSDTPKAFSRILLLVFLMYFLFKDAFAGRSIGKLCTGIRVIDESGKPCSPFRSFMRNVPLLVPIVPWVAGAQIWAFRRARIGEGWVRTHVERTVRMLDASYKQEMTW